jgi:hypothetical protein
MHAEPEETSSLAAGSGCRDAELSESRDAVGFRPRSDLANAPLRVDSGSDLATVQEDRHGVPSCDECHLVPLLAADRRIEAPKDRADAQNSRRGDFAQDDLYVMRSDGADVRPTEPTLTASHDSASQREPVLVADGKRIAFARRDDSSGDVFVVDANGLHLQQLTTRPLHQTSASEVEVGSSRSLSSAGVP